MGRDETAEIDRLREVLLEQAIEAWRFAKAFERVLSRLEPAERARFQSQLTWFRDKSTEKLAAAGMHLVDLTGVTFDAGTAATPVNIDEFEEGATLAVESMLEPIVMNGDGVVRFGKVVLKGIV